MNVLVVNCGSSSLKYEVYAMPQQCSLGKGLIERIGLSDGKITQKAKGKVLETVQDIPDHTVAFELMVKALLDKNAGIIASTFEIQGVGHRVVHGGEQYSASVLIDAQVIEAIKENCELAPLHNPANLIGIHEAQRVFPGIPQVAVFDTAFHQSLPPSAYLYGIPREFYDKYRIRRYGFHGTSHRFVAGLALTMMKRSPENTNLITCHLGNGASITAIQAGKSIDTSMGFTPLEGLMMGTRSGDLDPSIIFYLEERGFDRQKLHDILNKKSGLLGLSGISSDLRDIEAASEQGNKDATQALDTYAYRIRKFIGAYAANLIKLDGIVFTGGIGENAVKMRERICSKLENIGIHISQEKNRKVGGDAGIISQAYSPTTILVIPTNEELQIALDAAQIINPEFKTVVL
ncbi:MAG: acetate kinase [Candidatus Cloacimonadaceae bacterium]|jgi:acetate kinase|nr:acetate kinase [Candidatus Cloacimonadota bacterium]MDY0127257.1 acetate kinase [Candidatus Cloacimonadaceae bacterium]MCB5255866.1 acetate kinase [Candidatus Cloacimonadota bacterium]MCK9177793.1 acetate kinase [Candidatus Cloacimonadota bacterium]MCK9241947.1 acetate kinase [Candidatus Cloacimonadota bacterium]